MGRKSLANGKNSWLTNNDIPIGKKAQHLGQFKALAMGIVRQACDDYILAEKNTVRSLNGFFRSKYYESLCDVPGEYFIRELTRINAVGFELLAYTCNQLISHSGEYSKEIHKIRIKVQNLLRKTQIKAFIILYDVNEEKLIEFLYAIMTADDRKTIATRIHALVPLYFPNGLKRKEKGGLDTAADTDV